MNYKNSKFLVKKNTGNDKVVSIEYNNLYPLLKTNDGSDGVPGFQGDIGFQGNPGFIGNPGLIGPNGFSGNSGVRGNQGFQGEIGPQGSIGPQGAQGAQGVIGAQGDDGSAGIMGVTGAQGIQGNQGPVGSIGAIGVDGNAGIMGVTGSQGAQGAQGLQGNAGFPGNDGFAGMMGVTGAQGAQGAQGIQGNDGNIGELGFQGVIGISGIDPTQIFDAYDSTGGQTISSDPSSTIININVARQLTTEFSLASDVVTVNQSAIFCFIFKISANISSGASRSQCRIWMERNTGSGFTEVPATTGYTYHRDATDVSEHTKTIQIILNVNSGDQFRIVMSQISGTSTIQTIANASGISIFSLDGGPRGPQGAQGVAGNQGFQGVIGAQGAQGITSDFGATGAQGIQGLDGAQGAQGTSTQGAQGIQGPTGSFIQSLNAIELYDNNRGVDIIDGSWVNVTFNNTYGAFSGNIKSNISALDSSDNIRIDILEDGIYHIFFYCALFMNNPLNNIAPIVEARVFKNNSTSIPQSEVFIQPLTNYTSTGVSVSDHRPNMSHSFSASLNSGDYINYQLKGTNTTGSTFSYPAFHNFGAIQLKGIKGVTGPAGGQVGAVGDIGDSVDGATGVQGDPGTDGAPGAQGAQGAIVAQGSWRQFGSAGGSDGGSFNSGTWRIPWQAPGNNEYTVNELGTPGLTPTSGYNSYSIHDAGVWIISGSFPANEVDRMQTRFIMSGTPFYYGTSEYSDPANDGYSRSYFNHIFNLSSKSYFGVNQQCQTTRTADGFGVGGAPGGDIFVSMRFKKIG